MVMPVRGLLSRAGVILLIIHVDVLGVKFFIFLIVSVLFLFFFFVSFFL